jgi:hypothetical protein
MAVDVSLRCSRCDGTLVSTSLPNYLCDPGTLPFVLAEVLKEEAKATPCPACDGRSRPGGDRAFRRALRSRLASIRPGGGPDAS